MEQGQEGSDGSEWLPGPGMRRRATLSKLKTNKSTGASEVVSSPSEMQGRRNHTRHSGTAEQVAPEGPLRGRGLPQ